MFYIGDLSMKMAQIKECLTYTVYAFAGLCLAFSLVVSMHPQIRSYLQAKVYNKERIILSTTTGNVLGTGQLAKIVKIQSEGELFVEVYAYLEDGTQELVDRISIGKVQDAYFNVNGQSSNLILDDVDGDHLMEIVVPSFNKDLVANISILKYDEDRLGFVTIEN